MAAAVPPPPAGLPPLPDTTGIFRILSGDHIDAQDRLPGSDTGSNRRSLVRVLFALVEGMISVMGQTSLAFHYLGAVKLTNREVEILEDRRRPKLTKRVRCALECYARVFRVPSRLDVDSDGWRAFRGAVKVRNRITHPRRPADCNISDDDLREVRTAADWFIQLLTRSYDDVVAVLRAMGYIRP